MLDNATMVVVDESLKVTAVKTVGGGDFSLGARSDLFSHYHSVTF